MPQQADTMADGLRKILSSLAQLKLAPDADPNVLNAIEDIIVQANKQIAGQMAGGGPAPGAPPMGQPGMGGGGMDPAAMMGGMSPQSIGPGGGAGMAGLAVQPPNMDELRRVLGGTGVSG